MKITVIYGSPRKDGNTDLLLNSFLKGIQKTEHNILKFFLRDMTFSPCIECERCSETGKCVLNDDMNMLYPHLIDTDLLVLSSPVFFYGLNALSKAMVDRTQCFWALKYLLKTKLSDNRTAPAKGIFLSVGGSRGKRNFEGILLTARYFFDALDIEFTDHLVFKQIDSKGSINNRPEALDEACALAKKLTAG